MDPKDLMVFFVVIFVLVGGVVVLKPLAAALAERIRRAPELPQEGSQELIDEVRAMRQELAEIAERVDFTERLLARKSEPARLDQGEG